jgi:integrase/recombinase XerD
LAVIDTGRNPKRSSLMILFAHWAGMRVGQIAALRIGDVLNGNGVINDEVRLTPE